MDKELNSQILQLLHDYKQAIVLREAYKAVFIARTHEGLPPTEVQAAAVAVLPRIEKEFFQAEQELRDGKDPRTVLACFLHSEN